MEKLARNRGEQEGKNVASKIIRARRVVVCRGTCSNPVYRITPEEERGGGGGGGINLLLLKQDCFLRSTRIEGRGADRSFDSPPPSPLSIHRSIFFSFDSKRLDFKRTRPLRGSINYIVSSSSKRSVVEKIKVRRDTRNRNRCR